MKILHGMTDEQSHDFTEKLVSTTMRKIWAGFIGLLTILISAFWIYNDWKNEQTTTKVQDAEFKTNIIKAVELLSFRQDLSNGNIQELKIKVEQLENQNKRK